MRSGKEAASCSSRDGVALLFWQAAHLQKLVLTPLSVLLSLFPGPQKLIQKRYDKLLDYNSYLQRAAADESDLAKREYEALNAQLVEELQVFNVAARRVLLSCLCSFVTRLRDLMAAAQRAHSATRPVSAAPGSIRNHAAPSSLLTAGLRACVRAGVCVCVCVCVCVKLKASFLVPVFCDLHTEIFWEIPFQTPNTFQLGSLRWRSQCSSICLMRS